MPDRVMMGDVTWPEYAAALERNVVVFLPTGAVEQHGPHLPLSVDYLLAQSVAADVATLVGGLVTPPVCYGYKSMTRSAGGPFFPGSTGLDGATLTAIIRDVIRDLVRHGVHRVCVLDGNYENRWFLNEGIDLALRDPGSSRMRVMCLQHWEFLNEETLAGVFPDGHPGIELEHAGVIETSLMLHFHPGLVRRDRMPDEPSAAAPPYDVWPPHREWVTACGALASARDATAEKGKLIADQYRRDISAAVRRELVD